VITGTLLGVFRPDVGLAAGFGVAVIGALAGSIAELFSRRIDDNFTIPLASGLAAWAALLLLA
jgi:dolichol kinase